VSSSLWRARILVMLYGRRAQCDALERLLADARRSRSGALVVRGEAGAGKSALLGHAGGRAEGMQVLRATGVESEAELPFAALHQLLRPVLCLVDEAQWLDRSSAEALTFAGRRLEAEGVVLLFEHMKGADPEYAAWEY
jgi:AAA ATPase domain